METFRSTLFDLFALYGFVRFAWDLGLALKSVRD